MDSTLSIAGSEPRNSAEELDLAALTAARMTSAGYKQLLQIIVAVDSERLYRDLGFKTLRGWLRELCIKAGIPYRTSSKLVNAARMLRRMLGDHRAVEAPYTALAVLEAEARRRDRGRGRLGDEEWESLCSSVARGETSQHDLEARLQAAKVGLRALPAPREESNEEPADPTTLMNDAMARVESLVVLLETMSGWREQWAADPATAELFGPAIKALNVSGKQCQSAWARAALKKEVA